MMIDASEQGKGYGKAALEQVLKYIKTKPFGSSDKVTLTCSKENLVAKELYEKWDLQKQVRKKMMKSSSPERCNSLSTRENSIMFQTFYRRRLTPYMTPYIIQMR